MEGRGEHGETGAAEMKAVVGERSVEACGHSRVGKRSGRASVWSGMVGSRGNGALVQAWR